MQVASPKTFTTGAAVSNKRVVKLSGANVVHATATSTDIPIGVAQYAAASGAVVAVKLFGAESLEMTAAGAISAGASVFLADDGKVQALPAASATYKRIGVAAEAATADGDIIEVIPVNDDYTESV
jgi:hypothetical protein